MEFVSIFLLDTCVFKVLINTNISCNNNNEEDFVFFTRLMFYDNVINIILPIFDYV